jgi:hypothetical protein
LRVNHDDLNSLFFGFSNYSVFEGNKEGIIQRRNRQADFLLSIASGRVGLGLAWRLQRASSQNDHHYAYKQYG